MTLDALFANRNQVPLEDYMAWNNRQFYQAPDCLGAAGHFITSPELTPLFGYALAEWVIQQMSDFSDQIITLVELGPGRGLLMRDVLTALIKRRYGKNLKVALIEQSSGLRDQQKQNLQDFHLSISWFSQIEAINVSGPVLILANEFFDALPIQQWRYQKGIWHKRWIAKSDDGLRVAWQPEKEQPEYEPIEGAVYEVCPVGYTFFKHCLDLLKKQGGALVMIDYGAWQGDGDTLQAIYHHQQVDPLAKPGAVDLTAHVRFGDYAALTPTKWAWHYSTQGDFLRRLGIEALFWGASHQNPAHQAEIHRLRQRLLGAGVEDMGELFKVLEIKAQ